MQDMEAKTIALPDSSLLNGARSFHPRGWHASGLEMNYNITRNG